MFYYVSDPRVAMCIAMLLIMFVQAQAKHTISIQHVGFVCWKADSLACFGLVFLSVVAMLAWNSLCFNALRRVKLCLLWMCSILPPFKSSLNFTSKSLFSFHLLSYSPISYLLSPFFFHLFRKSPLHLLSPFISSEILLQIFILLSSLVRFSSLYPSSLHPFWNSPLDLLFHLLSRSTFEVSS